MNGEIGDRAYVDELSWTETGVLTKVLILAGLEVEISLIVGSE